VYHKSNGEPYDIYKDGLRIYTTIDSRMQAHAEWSVQEYMETVLQDEFDKNNKKNKNPPFANDADDEKIAYVMNHGMKNSDRYRNMKKEGATDKAIDKAFNTPVHMKVFSYKGDFDTIMTPMDSIRYYKGILQCGMMSMDPTTGFVKAWVGGPDFKHFAYDHVKQSYPQVGSTIKPFVYAAALDLGVIDPCKAYADMAYCIDVPVSPTRVKSWCPKTGTNNTGSMIVAKAALAGSLNNITVAIMKDMGPIAGPQLMNKVLKNVGINIREDEVTPSMCLGGLNIPVYTMVGAHSAFANKGMYIKPIYVMRIEDRNGNVIVDMEVDVHEAMDETIAYTMLLMMKGVISGAQNVYEGGKTYATSSRLRSTAYKYGGITYPMAGKTGTTNGASDGWFIGLTPELTTGVWVGADDPSIHFRDFTWGQGARMALPIYGYYMNKVYDDPQLKISTGDFAAPPMYDASIFNCVKQDQAPIL
jgi:penicillin-binding protein 1A